MAYHITDECISCGACEPSCPNEAITEEGDIYVIASDKCTECTGSYDSPRCVTVCPVDCCIPDPDCEESHEALLSKWQTLHPGETPYITPD
jgi:ferredoxin